MSKIIQLILPFDSKESNLEVETNRLPHQEVKISG